MSIAKRAEDEGLSIFAIACQHTINPDPWILKVLVADVDVEGMQRAFASRELWAGKDICLDFRDNVKAPIIGVYRVG